MEDYMIWTGYREEGERVVEAQDGYESMLDEASGNREKVVNEKTNVNREEVIDDVFRNMLADDTKEDGLSKILHGVEP